MMDDDLDDLLAQAGRRVPLVSPAFLARIEADALALQPSLAPPAAVAAQAAQTRWWALLTDVFGGSRGLAGLSLAAASGLWIGVAQPVELSSVTDYLATPEAMELLPSDMALLAGE